MILEDGGRRTGQDGSEVAVTQTRFVGVHSAAAGAAEMARTTRASTGAKRRALSFRGIQGPSYSRKRVVKDPRHE